MGACRSVLENAASIERAAVAKKSAAITSAEDERLQRFLQAKNGFGGALAASAGPVTSSAVVLPEGTLTMAERLDRMRAILAGEREGISEKASKTPALDGAAAVETVFDVEETRRVIAEIETQLNEATATFELAQVTKAQADARARDEDAALDFATNRLPAYLNRILGDDSATTSTMLEIFNQDYEALKVSGEMPYLLSRNGVTDVMPIAEVEAKIEALIAAESINDAFSLIKYVEEKRAVAAQSAAELLAESQRQEAAASALLDRLLGRFRVLKESR